MEQVRYKYESMEFPPNEHLMQLKVMPASMNYPDLQDNYPNFYNEIGCPHLIERFEPPAMHTEKRYKAKIVFGDSEEIDSPDKVNKALTKESD